MAFEIPSHYSESFTTNVELLLQRRGGALSPYVTMGSYVGKSAQVVKQFGEVEFATKTTRHGDTQWSDIQHKQRWVFPTDYNLALPIDNEDELRMLNSPLSPYVDAMRLAAARKMDDIIIDAFHGTSKTGDNGGTSTVYDTNNNVAVTVGNGGSGDVGLNVAKLRAARKTLLENEVDLSAETPVIAVTARQMDDLLAETEVTSSDFNSVKALVQGEIDTFLGFRFVTTQGLDADSNSDRKVPFWVPSGVHLAMWNGLETRIGERADKEYTNQVFMRMTIGACRTQEGKVGMILCDES